MASSNPSTSKPMSNVQASLRLHELELNVIQASLTHPSLSHEYDLANPVDSHLLSDVQGSRIVETPASCNVKPMTQREYYLYKAKTVKEQAEKISDLDRRAKMIYHLLDEKIEECVVKAEHDGEGKIVVNNKCMSTLIEKLVVENAYSMKKAMDSPVKAVITDDYYDQENVWVDDKNDLEEDLQQPVLNSKDSFEAQSSSKTNPEVENTVKFLKACIGDSYEQRDFVNGCPVPAKSSLDQLVPCGANCMPGTIVCYKHLARGVRKYCGCCTPGCLNTVFDLFSSFCTTCESSGNTGNCVRIPPLPESERTPMPIPKRHEKAVKTKLRPPVKPPFLPIIQNFLRQFEELKIAEGEFLSYEVLRERLIATNSKWTPEHLDRVSFRTVVDKIPDPVKTPKAAFDVLSDRLENSTCGVPDASDLHPILKRAKEPFEFSELKDPSTFDVSKHLLIPWPYNFDENYFLQQSTAAKQMQDACNRAIEERNRKKEAKREKRKKKKEGTTKTKSPAAKNRRVDQEPRFTSH